MGEVWIRTINQGLVRADMVTEIASTRGSVHEDQGYLLKVIVEGKSHVLIDDSYFPGTLADRLEHARHLEDALLLALDAAALMEQSVVVCFEAEGERWELATASELAGALTAEGRGLAR
ncbi:MAG TPA: hypothetical protein VIM08_16570 [Arthrobacter sp.]|jgi:hypothetical protein